MTRVMSAAVATLILLQGVLPTLTRGADTLGKGTVSPLAISHARVNA